MYLRSDQDQPFIARIEKMWTDAKYDIIMITIIIRLKYFFVNIHVMGCLADAFMVTII